MAGQKTLAALLQHFEKAPYIAIFNSNTGQGHMLPLFYHEFDWMIAVRWDYQTPLSSPYFESLQELMSNQPGYYCGYLGYELKDELEDLQSKHPNASEFPPAFFFNPQYILVCKNGKLSIVLDEKGYGLSLDAMEALELKIPNKAAPIKMNLRTSRARYLEKVNEIKEAIAAGTVYELNYCIEWYNENAVIDPVAVWLELIEYSPTPFSGFLKFNDHYLLCASPERFLKRHNDKLVSQPIKGTRKRGSTIEEDEFLANELRNDIKERAENVMIVDLVRNDLARSCIPGSVHVPELMQVFRFPTVHQMISTVTGTLRTDCTTLDAIKNAFPMGSMTGAPKVKAMELIDELEDNRRGVYSGAFGYFTPEGNCDFNVVIRSIVYNQQNRYLSFETGGAITIDSESDKEWDECLLKAKSQLKVLEGKR